MGINHPAWQLKARPAWRIFIKTDGKTGKSTENRRRKYMTTCHPHYSWFKWPLQRSLLPRASKHAWLIVDFSTYRCYNPTPSSPTEYAACSARWDILLLQGNIRGFSYVRRSKRPKGVAVIHSSFLQLASWTRKVKVHVDVLVYDQKPLVMFTSHKCTNHLHC